MKKITEAAVKTNRPVKILQYGEGNFLRAFVDWMVDIANEKAVFNGGVTIVKPIPQGSLAYLRAQNCMYTVLLRGLQDGETVSDTRLITSVAGAADCYTEYEQYAALAKEPSLRFIVSNTTEAGIVYDENDELAFTPPKSYPGKLTKLLYERWQAFGGAADKGCIILPVELIENNGRQLLSCCVKLCERWKLPEDFKNWLTEHNIFCQTLVDRIVTGFPMDEAARIEAELGYEDKMLAAGEPFALWVIESDRLSLIRNELPLDSAGLPVVFTDDLRPYRERKVRILNGAHTSAVLAAYLASLDTVGEIMKDPLMRALLERNIYKELLPCVPLPAEEARAFADAVLERFSNPFIQHSLLSVSLNSVSKFKTRVLPTIKETYARTGELPDGLCFSLATLIQFYSGTLRNGRLFRWRAGNEYEIRDEPAVLKFFAGAGRAHEDLVVMPLLARVDFWGEDLNEIPGLSKKITDYLHNIRIKGIRGAADAMLAL